MHLGVTDCINDSWKLTERFWESRPKRVKAPYVKADETVKTQAADGTALETMWESRWAPDYGDVAQLGEHLPCKQGVESSNLFISTARDGKWAYSSAG